MENTVQKSWTRRHPILTGFGALVILGIVVSSPGDKSPQPQLETKAIQAQEAISTASKDQAREELDAIMIIAKTANLVSSYDFSKLDEKVYRWDIFVGPTWYAQTVQQKKDFIAYIGIRKKIITGYSHFELRDAYNNDKVGEITAFSSSIEVYK